MDDHVCDSMYVVQYVHTYVIEVLVRRYLETKRLEVNENWYHMQFGSLITNLSFNFLKFKLNSNIFSSTEKLEVQRLAFGRSKLASSIAFEVVFWLQSRTDVALGNGHTRKLKLLTMIGNMTDNEIKSIYGLFLT